MNDSKTKPANGSEGSSLLPHPSAFRLLMMGTGPFAVPTFRALLGSGNRVLALVTRPERPAHRREKTPANPMREIAVDSKLPVFEPDSVNSPPAQAWLRDQSADLFVVCDYGQILSSESLAAARLGGINLHGSLLPKYRGAAPINWVIYHGETETGVTVIHMTPQLDAGPCLVQRRTPIGPAETAPQLETRLAAIGAEAVLEAIALLRKGDQKAAIPQDPKLASKAPRLKKEDGNVDWSRSAQAIANQVRAMQPWPTTYTFWQQQGQEPLRLILESAHPVVSPAEASGATAGRVPSGCSSDPGTVVIAAGEELVVVCGTGALRIDSLRPAGRRAMSAGEFLRGHGIKPGDRLA